MNQFTDRLRPFGPRFILVEAPEPGNPRSGKRAVESGFQLSPYSWDDPALQGHIDRGGNYGILAGQGLIIIDLDAPELGELFPETLTVSSGSGKGSHLYYRSDVTENGTIYDTDGENIGNVQAKFKYVVGPGSRHHSGGTYRVSRDAPVAWLSKADITRALANYELKWASSGQRAAETAAANERDLIGRSIPIDELVDVSQLTKIGASEWQGAHPIHGSKTGQNFNINLDKNSWHCFRCNSGGGPLLWLAVKHGLLPCSMAQPGALKGRLFWDTVNLARAAGFELGELGVPEHRPEHVAAYFNESGGFVPSRLAEEILAEYDLVTLPGPVTFVYHPALGVYVDDGENYVEKVVYAKLGEAFRGHRLNEVLKVVTIQSYTRQVDPVRPELIGVQNGILNVLTGELRAFTPEVFLTTKLPVAYDPDASSGVIEGFVAEVVSPEDGKVLGEFAGYCLYRGYPYAKAVVPYGRSRSGKSTFTAALTAMLGSHNVVAVTLQDLVTDRFAAAHLYNKLGNFVPDLDDAEVKHEGIFKALTGGDLITAAKKFKDSFEFRNYAKMLYGCNRLPRVTDDKSEAFFHRLIIVNFRNQFIGDNADPGILDRLTTPDALSGMLNWSIKGLQRLMERGGFRESKNTAIAKEQYMALQDTAKYFIDNHIERDAALATPRHELYQVYSEFCKGLGAVPETAKAFNMLIADTLSLEVRRIQVEGERGRCWLGIKVVGGPLLDHTLQATHYRALESGYEAVTGPIGRGGIRF